jgi:hypothetical protein
VLPDVVVADGGGRWVVGGEGEEDGGRANKRLEAAPRIRHMTAILQVPPILAGYVTTRAGKVQEEATVNIVISIAVACTPKYIGMQIRQLYELHVKHQ